MPDENPNGTPPEGQPAPKPEVKPEGQPTGTPNPPAESGDAPKSRTFTEEEVNAMVATRLSKHEKAVRKAIEQEQEEAKKQAEMTAEERAKAAEQKAAKTIAEYEARVQNAERALKLAGKVTKPERVLRLMDDPDRYFAADGKVNEKALAEDFPEYLPRTAAPEPDNRPARTGDSIDSMIRRQARGG